MSNYSIRLKRPDDKLDARVLEMKLGRKDILTPFKSYSDNTQPGIYEFSQSFSEDLLKRSAEEKTVLDKIPKKYNESDACINVLLPVYLDSKISDKAIEYMDNRIHPYSDIIVIPRWEGLMTKDNTSTYFEENWALSKRYLDEVRRLNGKLILGNIPMNHPQTVISKLLNNYIKEGVTSFLLDYERCNTLPKRFIVRDIVKTLGDHVDENDNFVLYNINMRRSHDYQDLKPADDFLSFSNGIDIIGNYHLPGGNNDRPKYDKVFVNSQWAYEDKIAIPGMSNKIKLENHQKINVEAKQVKQAIIEDGSAAELMSRKKGAAEYSNLAKQTELDFGGISF